MKYEIDPVMQKRAHRIIQMAVGVLLVTCGLSVMQVTGYTLGIIGMVFYTLITGMYFILYIYKRKTVNFILGILFYIGLISSIGTILAL